MSPASVVYGAGRGCAALGGGSQVGGVTRVTSVHWNVEPVSTCRDLGKSNAARRTVTPYPPSTPPMLAGGQCVPTSVPPTVYVSTSTRSLYTISNFLKMKATRVKRANTWL